MEMWFASSLIAFFFDKNNANVDFITSIKCTQLGAVQCIIIIISAGALWTWTWAENLT